jgi:sugar lactone lactonase YvrE
MPRSRASLLATVLATSVALPLGVMAVAARAQAPPPAGATEVAQVGFQTPESIVHDVAGDVYLVSNINGVPSAKDNNGFISRVSPDGKVSALKWVEGGQKGVTLHAPKGLAVGGDTLYVTDIDCVRRFNRTTGAAEGETCIDGATFLNDISVGPDGTVYVTDTGIRIDASGATPTGTDAVYRLASGAPAAAVIKSKDLRNPNGIVASADGLLVVPFGAAEIFHIDAKGDRHVTGKVPAGQLDGLVRLDDGTLLISSWEGKAVYRQPRNGPATAIIENVASPADIGYDAKRKRLLVPVFTENRVIIKPIE